MFLIKMSFVPAKGKVLDQFNYVQTLLPSTHYRIFETLCTSLTGIFAPLIVIKQQKKPQYDGVKGRISMENSADTQIREPALAKFAGVHKKLFKVILGSEFIGEYQIQLYPEEKVIAAELYAKINHSEDPYRLGAREDSEGELEFVLLKTASLGENGKFTFGDLNVCANYDFGLFIAVEIESTKKINANNLPRELWADVIMLNSDLRANLLAKTRVLTKINDYDSDVVTLHGKITTN